ncbi:MAG: dihydropteroate synthase [Caulobacteraceae bacterium]|nr:dihydropteroate synthase [Caulobacteraceae bacterium]
MVMGVVNTTPDSFSDGGRFLGADAAIAHARALLAQGADMLDIGGESTRPGAAPVPADEEVRRILPVIQAVRAQSRIPISVDTMKPEVMRAAAAAGADIWNDVTALGFSPHSLAVAAELGCGVILMHMQGEPGTMQDNPVYIDVVGEVTAFLATRAQAAMAAGVEREAIWVDPGIGFGKTLAHNLELLANLDRLKALDFRTVLGVSRKRFLRAIDPAAVEAGDRLGGSLAGALIGAEAGVDAVRAHDVRETVQALKVWAAVSAARPAGAS